MSSYIFILSLAINTVSAAATGGSSSAPETPASSQSPSAPDTTAKGATSAPSSPGGAIKLDSFELVLRIDLVLFIFFGLYVLTTLPRFIATIPWPAYSLTGFFLRGRSSVDYTGQPVRDYTTRLSDPSALQKDQVMGSAFSHSSDGFGSQVHLMSVQSSIGGTETHVPPRVRSWSAWTLPAAVSIMHYQIWPDVPVGKAIVLLAYFGLITFAAFDGSNIFSDPKRAGIIAMSQFPIVVALACKNNVLTWISGVGYEKLNYVHRFAGRLMALAANLHALGYVYKWALAGTFYTNITLPKYTWGLVALGALDLLFVGSISTMRQKSYNVFLTSHIVGLTMLAIGLYSHFAITLPYVASALAVYGFDFILRTVRTRATMGYVTAHSGLNGQTTHVLMPEITKGWRAGQHVRVRFIDPSSGAFGWIFAFLFTRTRPFSISSRPSSSGLELLIKKTGSSTRSVWDLASSAANSEKSTRAELGMPASRRVKVLVEGPYSGASYTMFESFSGVLLIAGGSGISYTLSILEDLVAKHNGGRSRVRTIEIVWSVGDCDSLTELLPTLRPLLRVNVSPAGNLLNIQMTVHYTRATNKRVTGPNELPNGLYINPGRPNMTRSLRSVMDRTLDATTTSGLSDAHGVVVTCCGPTALADDMNAAVGSLDYTQWRAVGGVQTVSETFGW